MFGNGIGSLNVNYRVGVTESRLYTISGNRGDMWEEQTVKLPKCASQFQISLEGVRGKLRLSQYKSLIILNVIS